MVHLTEKREGPENPYRVVDRSYANFGESPKGKILHPNFGEFLFHELG